jgi:hypothetical protein
MVVRRARKALLLSFLVSVVMVIGLWLVRKPLLVWSNDAFWLEKLLDQGSIPYLILGTFALGLIYAVLLFLMDLLPTRSADDFNELEKTLRQPEQGASESPAQISQQSESPAQVSQQSESLAKVSGKLKRGGRLRNRLEELESVYRVAQNRELTHEANDRATAIDEAELAYSLDPLVYVEWALPILGFIGTVVGVTGAVEGLRRGITALFRAQALTEEVQSQFMEGFRGLVLAFDTTLFGLIGLAVIGALHSVVRKNGMHVLIGIDRLAGRAVSLLPMESIPLLLRQGLFVTDEKGRLSLGDDNKPKLRMEEMLKAFFVTDEKGRLSLGDDNKPKLRWQEWMEEMLKGFFVTDAEGHLTYGDDKKPIPRIKEALDVLKTGFFVTDENGQLKEDGKPVLRWQEWMDWLLAELFVIDEDGKPVVDQVSHRPLSHAGLWRQGIMQMLVHEVYEVTESEAEAVVEGWLKSGEEVPLRSRLERRHRQLTAEIDFLALLLDRLNRRLAQRSIGDEDPDVEPAIPPTGIPVLAPSHTAVDALALDEGRFVIAREDGAALGDFKLLTGVLEAKLLGDFRLPMEGVALPLPERVTGLAIHRELIAYGTELGRSIEVRDWQPATYPVFWPIEGGEPVARSLVLLINRSRPHVAVAVEKDGNLAILTWPSDGSAPAAQRIVEHAGQVTAAATLHGEVMVCAIRDQEATQLVMVGRDLAVAKVDLPLVVSCLAFTGNSKLWYGSTDGTFGLLDVSAAEPEPEPRFRCRELDQFDFLGATAGGEIVTACRGRRGLIFVDPSSSTFRRVDYEQPITDVAISPQRESLLVGCADGSVYLLDVRNRGATGRSDGEALAVEPQAQGSAVEERG